MWRGIDSYMEDSDAAATDLAGALIRGELALFLGAGISMDSKLPSWKELVVRCCKSTGIGCDDIASEPPSDKLRWRIDEVEAKLKDPSAYRKCIHDALYLEYPGLTSPTALLYALGALMMGSRRGSVREVVTLNFDDVLETYLALHGFVPEVISQPQRLRRNVDVAIYHPHGFLPANEPDRWSDRIIFSQESFDVALDEEGPWKQQVRQIVTTKIPLAVGLSFSDPVLTSVISGSKTVVLAQGRPSAFWLMTKGADESERVAVTAAIIAMKKRNIVPLVFDTHAGFAPFLLSVCRHAANEMQAQFGSY